MITLKIWGSDLPIKYNRFNFPVGELYIQLQSEERHCLDITWEYENDGELLELVGLTDTIIQYGHHILKLNIPYFPHARQDRISSLNDWFSLKTICEIVNRIPYEEVHIIDPHSDVTPALLRNVHVKYQWEVFQPILADRTNCLLVSPDGGSLKKIYQLEEKLPDCLGVIQASKHRNTSNGKVDKVILHPTKQQENALTKARMDYSLYRFYIIDDICGGGKPFIDLAKELRILIGSSKLGLMVTHGFFTSGLTCLTDVFDEIWTRKGRIK